MKRPPGVLRIIGGQWRTRRVAFAAGDGLRATPDRVRQTLFDWLAPVIHGARCLDLYAGSGALGLEALSRGAAEVDFIDSAAAPCAAIRTALHQLDAASRGRVLQTDALRHLQGSDTVYDLVFLDPPFDAGLLVPALDALRGHLAPAHRVYLEWARGAPPVWPANLRWLREKAAGQVSYGLASLEGEPA